MALSRRQALDPVRENYDQLETFRQLGILVEKFGFTRQHPSIERAATYLLSFQTDEGDLRGIYGNQYAPTYVGAILEVLIKAGYADDPRIAKALAWLLAMRQSDGGWAIPVRTVGVPFPEFIDVERHPRPLAPDRSKPSSHLVTGMVLRAFAAHPAWLKASRGSRSGKASGDPSLQARRLQRPGRRQLLGAGLVPVLVHRHRLEPRHPLTARLRSGDTHNLRGTGPAAGAPTRRRDVRVQAPEGEGPGSSLVDLPGRLQESQALVARVSATSGPHRSGKSRDNKSSPATLPGRTTRANGRRRSEAPEFVLANQQSRPRQTACQTAASSRGWLVNPSRTRGDPSVQKRACRPAGHGEHARLSAVAGGLLRRRDGVGRRGSLPDMSLAFALMAAINGSTGSCATLSHGL